MDFFDFWPFLFENIPSEAAAAGFVAALSHKYGFAGLL